MLIQKSKFKSQNFNSKFKILDFLLLFLTFAFYLLPFDSARAQTDLPEGITVIPSIMNIDLATDPADYDIKYINNTPADITLLLSAQDFNELEDGYRLNFLEGKDAQNYKYSLSSWISFENKNIQLTPGEEKTVKIFIDKDRITKGGHYASVLARVDQANSKKVININPVISSLLFVRAATGNEIESAKISTLKPERSLLDFPYNFILRLQNDGNVFLVPYGTLEIHDPLGRRISKSIVNEGSLNTLPESIRRYEIKVNSDPKFLLPGLYTAKLKINYGKNKQELSQNVKFFSQGSFDFIKIILILIPIILAVFYIRKRKKAKS